jgi:hypothetical protein
MKAERRISNRKEVYPLNISSLAVMDSMTKLVRHGIILNASPQGMLLHIKRDDIIPKSLKGSLTLDSLVGDLIVVKIDEMNLEISGSIARTRFLGKEGFELAIDYSTDAPLYWRECLMDLLPTPEEFDDLHRGVNNLVSLKNTKRNR